VLGDEKGQAASWGTQNSFQAKEMEDLLYPRLKSGKYKFGLLSGVQSLATESDTVL
jgi:hypothetical protein